MSDEPRYCHKCKAWHSPTDAGWQAGCATLETRVSKVICLVSPPDPVTLTSEADIFAQAECNGKMYRTTATVSVFWKPIPND